MRASAPPATSWRSHTETGKGVPIDRDRAKAFYKKACDGGDKRGCDKVRYQD